MIKLKIKQDERYMSDGQCLSSGNWLVNLDKIPLGELLKEKMDIICGSGKQLSLFEDTEMINRDFSKLIPSEWQYELTYSEIIFDAVPLKEKYRLYADTSNGVFAWINDEYLKIFSDVKTVEKIVTKGQDQPVQFLDADNELIFLIMPCVSDGKLQELSELYSRYKCNKQNNLAKDAIDAFDYMNINEPKVEDGLETGKV